MEADFAALRQQIGEMEKDKTSRDAEHAKERTTMEADLVALGQQKRKMKKDKARCDAEYMKEKAKAASDLAALRQLIQKMERDKASCDAKNAEEKATLAHDLTALRRRVEDMEADKTSRDAEILNLQQEIKELLAENGRQESDIKMNENPIAETSYLREDALDGFSYGAKGSIDAGINMSKFGALPQFLCGTRLTQSLHLPSWYCSYICC
jgi:hypothetical protein